MAAGLGRAEVRGAGQGVAEEARWCWEGGRNGVPEGIPAIRGLMEGVDGEGEPRC